MPRLKSFPIDWVVNAAATPSAAYGADQRRALDEAGFERAWSTVTRWPGYRATPLVSLPGLARAAGVAELRYKDEGGRFGLGSFKALGGAYAVYRLLARMIATKTGGTEPAIDDLLSGRHRDHAKDVVVASATDGNHGRSVAWGAKLFGCRCVIFIHATVSEARRQAIAAYGADVIRIKGNYDDSVHHCAAESAKRGWHVVSDTAYDGYWQIPCDVMQGYAVMAEEIIREMSPPPTHVFLQGGVGGLAAAVVARFWQVWGTRRPRAVVVEPVRADCLFQSAKAGRPTKSTGDLDTLMAGLAAGEVSLAAWEVLKGGATAFMIVPDEAAVEAMRLLAQGVDGDPRVVGGEAGVGGLAGLLAATVDGKAHAAFGLTTESRVLTIGSEGDTDPELYRKLVGRSGDEVRAV
ncbi:MAG: diaminopropionate ammonia-lyase [Alphaproteobacteria bacterium]|nr:diaminopropionate ammonia-lyase [Alphaproteobacteria bacterium]